MNPPVSGLTEAFRSQTGHKRYTPSSTIALREKIVLTFLALNICFLAYAYGGYPNWALWTFLSLSTGGFLALFIPIKDHTSSSVSSNIKKLLKFPVFWLGLIFISYILIQASNPAAVFTQEDNVWLLKRLPHNSALPTSVSSPFDKINPYRVLLYILSAFFMSCSLWVGIRKRRSLQTLFWVFLANGLVFATIGLYLKFINVSKLLGIKYTPVNTMFSSFVYSNHAAAYTYLLLSVALGFCLYYLNNNLRSFNKSTPYLLCGLIVVFLWVTLFVIASRGGIGVATAIALIAILSLAYLLAKSRKNPYTKWIALTLLIFLFGSVATCYYTYDWNKLDRRFDRLEIDIAENSSRGLLRTATYEMFQDNPVYGWGAGSFRYYFPIYREKYPSLKYRMPSGRIRFYTHAHSDWMETLSDYGIVGTSMISLIGLYFFSFPILFFRSLTPLSFMVFIGCLGFIGHAYFDFVFQSPTLFITFCFLLIAGARAVYLKRLSGRK